MTGDEAVSRGAWATKNGLQVNPHGVLLYLHIPKTAGSALSDLLTGHFPKGRCYNVWTGGSEGSEEALRSLPMETKSHIDHVYGHFAFGLHDTLPRPCRYYTVFRNPIDRVVSLYYFIRASRNHPGYQQVSSMSLVEFALSGHPEIENCQTKMLSGRANTHFMTGRDPCDETDLELAMAHLDANFVACGIFEDLPRSLYVLCSAMGWKYSWLERKNVTKRRRSVEDLREEERSVLESINRYDMRLYEHALRHHERMFAELGLMARIRWHALRFSSLLRGNDG